MSKLNENIKKFRTFRRITQADLAVKLGKTKNVISNWERGDNSPDPDTIEKLCGILNVTPNQLFGWDPMPEYEHFMEYMEGRQNEIYNLERQNKAIKDRIEQINKEIEEYKNDIE